MIVIITASPNADGLTAACGKSAYNGVLSAGGEADMADISAAKLEPCLVCAGGWGTCRPTGSCVIGGLLSDIQQRIRDAEGVILITPVYFGQPSERMKYFLDRYRRCEAFRTGGSWAKGRNFHLVAAAGGSGNGTATCLAEMETWVRQVGGNPCERIGVTRYNREKVLPVVEDAAARLVRGEVFVWK